MPIPQISVAEAHDKLSADARTVYLDVRTDGEFEAGHPAGARNVPVFFFDQARGGAVPNPDFVAVVERNFPRDTPLVVGCQAGMRSQRACEMLVAAGYTDVANVAGGFGGARDASGRIVAPGWMQAGLPVDVGAPAGRTYTDLVAKR